jgi:tetratricopeptide (TPR) repeat protein
MEETNFWEEAESLIEQFEYDSAINIYRNELKNNPNDTKIMDALGDVLLLKGDTPQAQKILASSIALSPEEGASKYMNMAQILEGQDSLKHYQKGIELLQKEKENAQSEDQQSITERIATGLVAMAEIYMTDECDAENAESECDRLLTEALRIDPLNPEVKQQLANNKMNQQNPQEALQYLKQSKAIWSDKEPDEWPSYEFRTQTAKFFIELNEFETAAEILDALIEEYDENSEIWFLTGLSYSNFDPEEALQYLITVFT